MYPEDFIQLPFNKTLRDDKNGMMSGLPRLDILFQHC